MIRFVVLPAITVLIAFTLPENPSRSVPGEGIARYPEHLRGAFTGGFGEETCRSCHFDYDLNPGDGRLSVSGIPDIISGGESIQIKISVERKELGRAGFQLSARYDNGKQAGSFDIGGGERMIFSKAGADSLEYIQHSNSGSKPLNRDKTGWTVTWTAPESLTGPVIFNIAANAANGDQSEFGDFIYAEEVKAGI